MEAESVLRRRAFHEAGHCVVGFYRLGLVPVRSTVVPSDDGQTLGRTDWPYAESSQLAPFIADAGRRLRPMGLVAADEQAARDWIALHVAGEVVAKRLTGVAMPDLAGDDLVKAMSLARYIDLQDPESIIEQISREVDADISERATWQVIETIADVLLAGSTLERAELARLLAGA
jgi:hypothetical protein